MISNFGIQRLVNVIVLNQVYVLITKAGIWPLVSVILTIVVQTILVIPANYVTLKLKEIAVVVVT